MASDHICGHVQRIRRVETRRTLIAGLVQAGDLAARGTRTPEKQHMADFDQAVQLDGFSTELMKA